jgi:hypothetical protein
VIKSRLLINEEDYKEANETLDLCANLFPPSGNAIDENQSDGQLGDYEKAFTMVDNLH